MVNAAGSLRRAIPLACLSFAIAAVLDVMGTGAPLALHASGLPLADSGWLQTIYLPAGLGLLWAPLIDRPRTPGLWVRKRLVIVAMFIGGATLALIGAVISFPLLTLLTLAFGASIAVCVGDLASQVLVIQTVPSEERAWLVTTRLIASSAGSSAGVAAATVAPGWSLQGALVSVGLGTALLGLPMLAYPERSEPPPIEEARDSPVRQSIVVEALVLSAYSVAAIMLTASQGLALLDIGVSLPVVGIESGIATTLATAAAMIFSAAISGRATLSRQIAWCTIAVGVAASLLIAALVTRLPMLATAAMLLVVSCDAGLNVPFMRLMYRWSEGRRPAARFATLSSVVFFVSFPARLAGPALAACVGWPAYFSMGLAIYLAAGAALCRRASLP